MVQLLELEGTRLGRYRLRHRLGEGGMAEVYLAYDGQMRRDVAIKVVEGGEADLLTRFQREVEVIGSLTHEHILPVFDYGEQDGCRYLVMPYVEGATLGERLDAGPLAVGEIGHILTQVASALQFAHERGVIHRDIKPSNILLRGSRYAYLADFGLAKPMDCASNLTRTGYLLGTPEYMAPELAGSSRFSSRLQWRPILVLLLVLAFMLITAGSLALFFLNGTSQAQQAIVQSIPTQFHARPSPDGELRRPATPVLTPTPKPHLIVTKTPVAPRKRPTPTPTPEPTPTLTPTATPTPTHKHKHKHGNG